MSPINSAVVEGSFTTLTATAAALKYGSGASPLFRLSYQFELFDAAGARVQTETLTASSWTVSGLRFDSRYTWRVRAMLDGAAGPWSTVASFATPPQSFVSGRIIFAPDGPAIPGARIQVDGLPAVTADAAGRFPRLERHDHPSCLRDHRRWAMTRETYLPAMRIERVDLDLVPASPVFLLQYREDRTIRICRDSTPRSATGRPTPNFTLAATWKDSHRARDPAVYQLHNRSHSPVYVQ